VNTHVDCPNCGSEFTVSEDIAYSTLRCPDCLNWFNSMEDILDSRPAYAGYSGYGESVYDDYGFQEGYDY